MSSDKKQQPINEPVLFSTHNDLKEVLNNTSILIGRIRNSSARLHPFQEGGGPTVKDEKAIDGVVNHFKEEIARANNLNEELNIIASHLETVIGS